jgi:hypothetical protein
VSDGKDQIRKGKLQGRYRKRAVAIYLLSRSLASEPRRCRAQTRPSPEDELPAYSGITIIVCSGFAGPGPITP